MISGFKDEVRFGAKGLLPPARDAMLRLYLDPADFNKLLKRDEGKYMAAVTEATKDYLAESDFVGGLIEPIKPVAQRYMTGDLGLTEIAAELDMDETTLRTTIDANDSLRRKLGLAGVAGGGKIKRAAWESGPATSLFQSAAMELRLGSPENTRVQCKVGKAEAPIGPHASPLSREG